MNNDITTTPSSDSGQPVAPETQDDNGAQVQPDDQGQPAETPETTTTPTGEKMEETPFDPNTVPEELKPLAKQLQADYTRKTQAIANERKEIEALRKKADSFAKYEQYMPVLDEMLAPKDTTQLDNPQVAQIEQQLKQRGFSDEAIELAKIMSGGLLNIFNQTQSQQAESARLEKAITEASSLDPRLNDSALTYDTGDGQTVSFGQIVENLVLADPSARQDPVQATRRAIKQVDAMLASAKTAGKEELSSRATSRAKQFPQTSSSPRSAVSNAQPSSIHEAWKQAQAELNA